MAVRGIATSISFRWLVSKSLARQFIIKKLEDVCSQFHFALITRAGSRCEALTDLDGTVMSMDSIGAYDHVFRNCMKSLASQGLRSTCDGFVHRTIVLLWRDSSTQHGRARVVNRERV